jgi:hypothetical protein
LLYSTRTKFGNARASPESNGSSIEIAFDITTDMRYWGGRDAWSTGIGDVASELTSETGGLNGDLEQTGLCEVGGNSDHFIMGKRNAA